ncbi:MAG: protein translocase subunit SecD [Gammaproteobacteria bacterium]|nr:MAG: protein translocase subunit SecD [Gammaproteobacteria bacterium]
MNQYPLWKQLLILSVLLLGVVYALPNLYGEDPALQISSPRGEAIDSFLRDKVIIALEGEKLPYKSIDMHPDSMVVRFSDTETQLKARDIVAAALGEDYVVAVNLAPSTPAWLRAIGGQPMNLGLDLRGGVHFLMQVDMEAVRKQAETRFVSDLKSQLREEKIRYRGVKTDKGTLVVSLRNAADREKAEALIRKYFPELQIGEGEGSEIRLTISREYLEEVRKFALQQNITTLRKRVNELGVAEPTIQQQGRDRIVVQLPGVQDTARAKDILGATATLEFHMVDTEHDIQDALDGKPIPGSRLYRDRQGQPVLLKKRIMLTGDHIIDASSGIDSQSGSPAVFITLDGKGAAKFARETRERVGQPMAVVFIEYKSATRIENGKVVRERRKVEEVINIATIREQLSKRFQITGLDSTEEARKLALLLRAGALAAPVEIIEERTVGPSLGQENIDRGVESVIVGFILVLLFMAVYYKVFGLFADVALFVNLVLIVALLSLLQATLTLPGIAGIVLTVGMAVDANVLIYERIREELRNGNSPHASIRAGYEKAFSTIADANITTLIAAIVLFGFGTGPIKGFAVTLSLGILTSMFTAIMGTRALVSLVYGGRRIKRLAI